MMRFRLAGWLGLLWGLRLWAGSFQMGLDRESIETGGTAVLIYSFTDYGDVPAPPVPVIAGAEVQYLGASTQSSITFINGHRTQQTSLQHRYGITPKAEGVLTIPETSFIATGERISTRALSLTVTKGLGQEDFAHLQLLTPTNTLYVGQPFVARIQFWVRQSPSQVGNPQLPTDGFVSGRAIKPYGRQERVGNEIWGVSEYPILFSAARAGSLPIGPAEMEAIFPVGPRRGGIFGDFFGEQRRFTFRSGSNNVDVLAPPTAGQPPGFNGTIGRFTLRVTAQPTTVTVGDPITVKVIVQGRGGLDNLALPEFAPDSGFRTYPGTNGVQLRDPLNFEGSKVFELAVVPERSDLTALKFPPLVSFDPDTQTYVVAEAPPVPLVVKPGLDAQAAPSVTPTYAANTSTNEGPVNASQLRALGTGMDRPVRLHPPWTERPWYWVVLALPTLGWTGWWVGNRWRLRRQTDPETLRRTTAEARAAQAWERLETSQGPEFFAALDQALRERIAITLRCAPGAVDDEIVERELTPRGLDEADAQRLRRLFRAVAAGRFAPVPSAADAKELRQEAGLALAAVRALEGRS